MYGRDMGTLSVSRNETQLWTKTGDQGDTWHWAEIEIGTSTKNYKVNQQLFLFKIWKYFETCVMLATSFFQQTNN